MFNKSVLLCCSLALFALIPGLAFAEGSCRPTTLQAEFSVNGTTVIASSNKALSNVVLKFCDGSADYKFDGLSGYSQSFTYDNKTLAGVWIKSGCNASGDGPGYGTFFGRACINVTPTPTITPTPTPTPELIQICYKPAGAEQGVQKFVTQAELDGLAPSDYTIGKCSEDCSGIPGGNATLDLCGVCGGDGSACKDCEGVPNGGRELDSCGVCGGDNSSCAGCDGVPNSGRVIDACGICGGDSTGCLDCANIPNGGTRLDACGVCGGNSSSCLDCSGIPNGTKRVDACNVCGGDGSSCGVITTCDGVLDQCGVCDGNNACLDCAGIPNGGTKIDCCGVCGGDGSTCLDKCKFYNIRAIKKKYRRDSAQIQGMIQKYTGMERRCGGAADKGALRLKKARLLLKRSKKLMASMVGNTIKVCNTPYCTKSSLKPVVKTLARYTEQLYGLSRDAQRSSRALCRIEGGSGSGSSGSQNLHDQAIGNISQIPDRKCD